MAEEIGCGNDIVFSKIDQRNANDIVFGMNESLALGGWMDGFGWV